MGWRIVYITVSEKMSVSLDQLVLSRGNEKLKIPLEDIDTLVIEDIRTVITASSLARLCEFKVNVLFCDEKHNPCLTLLPVSGYFRQGKRVKEQLAWPYEKKAQLWQQIIQYKIRNQADVCQQARVNAVGTKLRQYAEGVLPDDLDRKEAVAARLYFRAVFGEGFVRGADDVVNAALNYGYTIILSCFNRSLAAKGLLPYWGIKHSGEYNAFNLSCDFMEPFRPFVDSWVLKYIASFAVADPAFKGGLVGLLGKEIIIKGRREKIHNAVDLFCDDCVSFLSNQSHTDVSFPHFTENWWENEI